MNEGENTTGTATEAVSLGPIGRDPKSGKFLPGNKCFQGDPYAARRAEWRRIFYRAMSPAAALRILRKLIERAEAGESWAIKECTDRLLGKALQPISAEINVNGLNPLLEALRQRLEEQALPAPDQQPALPSPSTAGNAPVTPPSVIQQLPAPEPAESEIVDPGDQDAAPGTS